MKTIQNGSPATENGIIDYYRRRAAEYDQIYQIPERQAALRQLEERVSRTLTDRRILDIACGTGYWTGMLARTARMVVAMDINAEMIEIARNRCKSYPTVEFYIADAFKLPAIPEGFDGVFMGFWWSHIPKQDISDYLVSLYTGCAEKIRVVMVDNLFVEGSSTPIHRTDDHGNGYQIRGLTDGSHHEVLKNFPDENEIRSSLSTVTDTVMYWSNQYYWMVEYETGA